MSSTPKNTSRRDFLRNTGRLAAASALAVHTGPAGFADPAVHVAENNTIQLALVGCGGRGTGAIANAIEAKGGPVKLVAMADTFEDRLARSYTALHDEHPDAVDVPEDRKFIGFDAYKDAMDALNPGDVVVLATPPAFRWVHFTYAIERGLNVFMEKPISVDGPTTRRMMKLAQDASGKDLKVGVGLMVRHCRGRMQLKERIDGGEIGEIVAMRAYRMGGPMVSFTGPTPAEMTPLEHQIRRFHCFLWASGGAYSDYYIHQIDECSWMKGMWPVEAQGNGGRHYRGDMVDQNFDNYSVEYTYPDGTKLLYYGRNMNGAREDFASYVHGTLGSAIVSMSGHTPGKVRTFRGHKMNDASLLWAFPQPEPNPYVMEWEDLLHAIREDEPFNEVKRGAEASLVSAMGRMAAHTGRIVTYDEILNCEHEFAPDVDKLVLGGPAPIMPAPDGSYPVPEPGIVTEREYA